MELIFERLIQPGFICLDIGAHFGQNAFLFARKGAKKVYAIEANLALIPNIKLGMIFNGISNMEIDHYAIIDKAQ